MHKTNCMQSIVKISMREVFSRICPQTKKLSVKLYFLINQLKHLFWVLKRTILF